jgi:hypothetical protein
MSTLVAVQCYSGDAGRVEDALEQYVHHRLPVLILSPIDAPVESIRHPQILHRTAGFNAYDGSGSVERYRSQLGVLAEYGATHILLNESDSFCLSDELPGYLYRDDNIVWGNYTDIRYFLMLKSEPDVEAAYAKHNPAINAPWFFSVSALEKMLSVFDEAVDALPPYARGLTDGVDISWWFHTAAHLAGLEHRSHIPLGVCRPITSPSEAEAARREVLSGAVMIHAVKDRWALEVVRNAYRECRVAVREVF